MTRLYFLNKAAKNVISKKRIFAALKYKSPVPQRPAFIRTSQDFIFGKPVAVTIGVPGPDSTVKAVVFANVCKLNQSADKNISPIDFLPYRHRILSKNLLCLTITVYNELLIFISRKRMFFCKFLNQC